jgi:hypothetical protein
MKTTNEHKRQLGDKLLNTVIELREKGEANIKAYEIAFQDAIEEVFPDECWWNVTSCEIFMHLFEHRDPSATVVAILKGLKEE